MEVDASKGVCSPNIHTMHRHTVYEIEDIHSEVDCQKLRSATSEPANEMAELMEVNWRHASMMSHFESADSIVSTSQIKDSPLIRQKVLLFAFCGSFLHTFQFPGRRHTRGLSPSCRRRKPHEPAPRELSHWSVSRALLSVVLNILRARTAAYRHLRTRK